MTVPSIIEPGPAVVGFEGSPGKVPGEVDSDSAACARVANASAAPGRPGTARHERSTRISSARQNLRQGRKPT
jgi:hypothetical protein